MRTVFVNLLTTPIQSWALSDEASASVRVVNVPDDIDSQVVVLDFRNLQVRLPARGVPTVDYNKLSLSRPVLDLSL